MKKFSFLAMAALGLLFAACSSEKDVQEGSATTINANGDGFIGISISLPSADAPTTRANDDLVNGKADEFEVKAAHLYLFKGADEAHATFLKRYELTNDFLADNKGAQETPQAQDGVTLPGGTAITSTSVSVCKVQNVELASGEHFFAYVVVNPQGELSAEPASGTPFSEFSVKEMVAASTGGTLDGVVNATYGMLMTNSPISDKAAGDAAPSEEKLTTLVKLADDAIKVTEAAAKDAPAGCVYVERAAAKVTVNDAITGTKQITLGTGTLSYEIDGWQIINTEPKFYNARQVETTWDALSSQYWAGKNTSYRFITKYDFAPTLPLGGTHATGYRTYFAKDLQYDAAATLDHQVAGEAGRTWLAAGDRAFVPENTFDVDHQTRTNTTQVTLRVKFNGGTDFFTISDDANYYLTGTIDATVAAKVQALYNVNKFMEDLKQYELDALKADNASKYYKANVTLTATVDKSAAKDAAPYTVAYTLTTQESDTEGGTYADCTAKPLSPALEAAWAAAKAEAEAALTVSCYKGGLSYYNIRIQHFGEYETPWAAARGVQPGETIEQIYGAAATRTADYLGRYGVVRDNWYNLSIDAIAKLGSAEPKPVNGDNTPDDEIQQEYYISAHVHILPWVLRTQHVTF